MKYLINARRSTLLVFATILSASFLFAWQTAADLQTKEGVLTTETTERKVSVSEPQSRGKHVNFFEGHELAAGENASGYQPIGLTKADFDSDGNADLVTTDANGTLQLLKGIDPANFAIGPTEQKLAQPEPFSAVATGSSLGISPDFLLPGDFNADGKQDIIGAVKGAGVVVVVAGDGSGHFSLPTSIAVDGNISAVESGEIGKPDGQTDLAVTYSNKSGSFLAVYEHPESAFKHKPEIIKLPSAATAITIGNTDEDFYSDIAIACGSDLVIIHERGQAYPWDIVKDSGVVRPSAVVDVRKMPFSIASMAVGRFGDKRGTSLAILGGDGNIYNLEPKQTAVSPGVKLASRLVSELKADPFEPADSKGRAMAMISREPQAAGEVDAYGNPVGDTSMRKDRVEMLKDGATNKTVPKFDPEEVNRRNAQDAPRKAAMQQRTKDAFIRGISARTTRLAKWEIHQITTDHRFVSIAASEAQLTRASVSDSPFDDLIVTSSSTGLIDIILRPRDESGKASVENFVIDGNGAIQTILPLRLNLDGLSDLVVLRQGASAPEAIMTAPTETFVVNTTADVGDCNFGGSCSLRDAITKANLVVGSSTIYFDNSISSLTIAPLSPLPAILQPITIQGNHQSDGTKLVEISGVNAGTAVDGLKIRTSNAFIYDLAITGFKSQTISGSQVGGNGIVIESDSALPNNVNNNVLACFLGIDAAGTTAKPNMAAGLLIFDSDGNFVTNTVASGNNTGIAVEGGNSNYFAGNTLGLNAGGTAKVPNASGMFLAGADNHVGGDYSGASNTISGNGVVSSVAPCVGYGIYVAVLADVTTQELLTHDNNISGNKIGTDRTGTVGLGNCWQGINTNPITSTTVGSITETGRNLISGNGWGGVWCEAFFGDAQTEGGFCSIMGNDVGTDITGNNSIYNDAHNTLQISGPPAAVSVASNFSLSAIGSPGGTAPGGPCTGFCNLVSGNANTVGGLDLASGIEIGGPGVVGVFNNYIGTKRNGVEPLANNGSGIDMASTTVPGAAPVYFAGGHTIDDGSLGNLVAANPSFTGIEVNSNGYPGDYHVLGNLVGTDVSGTNALPNGFGVYVGTWTNNTVEIGDTHPLGLNIISGNSSDGIAMLTGYGVKIVNNKIGVNSSNAPLGNGRNGVNVGNLIQVFNNSIGGTDAASSNIIANNGKAGVKINAGNILNPIRGNSIYNNATLGIDLSNNTFFPDGDGVTDNDCLDGDVGANGLQNFPVLLSTANDSEGHTKVIGYLRSSPSQDFSLDFFSNDVAEPSHHGEGKIYVGSMSISTNGSGFRSFEYTLPSNAFGLITATATDSFGNTSEFSCDIGACTDPVRPVLSKEEADELYAVSVCADPIVVNTTSDAEDVDLLDETCDIDDAQPGPQCSLRAAIQEAEHQPGANAITFDIPGGGTHTITPATPLPILNQPVSIDASTQPGYSGVPLIVLDGSATTNAYGFAVRGGNSLVRGFAVINFKEQIGISGSSGGGQNRIGGNYIGIRPDGTMGDIARQLFGITLVNGSINNQIGGFLPENRNVIGASGQGISVAGGSNHNRFNNNYVGIAADGVTPIPNHDGIVFLQSDQNNIGGYIDNAPNVISFNQDKGILLSGSSSNRVSGNLIGTTGDGNRAAGNVAGVTIDAGSGGNVIGGTTATEKNVISGQTANNNSVGVLIKPDAGSSNTVAGNYLGVSIAGDIGLPNRVGIAVNADNQIIGNADESQYRNLIVSADTEGAYGIYLHAFFPNDELTNVTVQNNTIGTLSFNKAASGQLGVYLTGNVKSCTVKGNTIGHQSFAGIRLFDGPHNNTISGNRVGIKTTNAEIPNYNGIAIRQADTNVIRDNFVSGNTNHGIVIGDSFGQNDRPAPVSERSRAFGASSFAINNIVTGNRVGTDVDATYLIPNGGVAIGVGLNARDTRIGGPGVEGNIVGGASGQDWPFGIFVGTINDVADTNEIPHNIKIEGNRVGVGAEPDQSNLANGFGIYIRNAADTIVGGDTAGQGNIVGNNQNDGIRVFKPLTTGTLLSHNFVGVLPDENTAGNGADGISVDAAGNIDIISNVVGANQGNGIYVANMGAAPTVPSSQLSPQFGGLIRILKNEIGVIKINATLAASVGNALNGLKLQDCFGAEIGKSLGASVTDALNILAANKGLGMLLQGGGQNKIFNNWLGTTPSGQTNIANLLGGMKMIDSNGNFIGSPGLGNIFAGNVGDGIISETSSNNDFSGNFVGVYPDEVGSLASSPATTLHSLPNAGNGMSLIDSGLNAIGIATTNGGNIFASNQQVGIRIDGFGSGANRIWNNKIGVVADPPPGLRNVDINFGNGSHGVLITNAANGNQIGSTLPGTGNTIGGNGGNGVWIDPTAGSGNIVDPNIIFGNAGLGIDLGSPGYTWNDSGDADTGPNNLQNYPEISNFVVNVNGDLLVSYIVDSDSGNSNYGNDGIYVEFFKSDPGNEGLQFLGFDHYTLADHGGSLANTKTINLGNASGLGFNVGDRITATATDADNNTSEFYPAFAPTAAGVTVSGRVKTNEAQGVRNAYLTLVGDNGQQHHAITNGLGYYHFEDIQAGRTYVLTVSHKQFVFENPSRLINLVDKLTDVDFIVSP